MFRIIPHVLVIFSLFLPVSLSAKMVSIDFNRDVAWICDNSSLSVKIRAEDKAQAKVVKIVITACKDLKLSYFCDDIQGNNFAQISEKSAAYINENVHINLPDMLSSSGLVGCKGL